MFSGALKTFRTSRRKTVAFWSLPFIDHSDTTRTLYHEKPHHTGELYFISGRKIDMMVTLMAVNDRPSWGFDIDACC